MNKVAVIDMGTNTFHLVVAEMHETHHHIILRDRLPVKIGMGGIVHGFITDEGIERALQGLRHFKTQLQDCGVSHTYAFGTSALRNAQNKDEIVHKIKSLLDINVNVISGDEEAMMIYLGVRDAVTMEATSMIMDIGGGSVEFIIANAEKIFWKKSIEIGAQRLMETFHHHDPITEDEIRNIENMLCDPLACVFDALAEHQPAILVGSAGTFDTLSEIYCRKEKLPTSPHAPETPLTQDAFHAIYTDLIRKNRTERMQIPGMIDLRVDMIVVASVLINYVLERYKFKDIKVSSYSLREGALAWVRDRITV